MALQRMKWSNTGAELIRTQARDGATVRQIDEPRSPRRAVHIHIHGARVADQAAPLTRADPTGGLPEVREGQNVEPEEAGFRDRGITLRGRDQGGRNWSARIYGPDGAGYEEKDPDKIFTSTGDANAGGPGELEAGKTFEQRMSAALAPGRGADQRNPASLRGLQRLMDQHYRRR